MTEDQEHMMPLMEQYGGRRPYPRRLSAGSWITAADFVFSCSSASDSIDQHASDPVDQHASVPGNASPLSPENLDLVPTTPFFEKYDFVHVMSWNEGTNDDVVTAAASDPWGASLSGPAPPGGGVRAGEPRPPPRRTGFEDYPEDRPDNGAFEADRFDGNDGDRTCFGCGQPGHNRADCPDKTPMNCRICGDLDHLRKHCPQKPAETCRNCKEEGHEVVDCTNPRKIDYEGVPEMTDAEAWDAIIEAVGERDAIEVKTALMAYLKHHPDLTYLQLEEAFRRQNLKVYIIGLEREVIPTMTLMDLQGNLGKKYYASFRFSEKASRPREFDAWPKTKEENLERLADAGEAVNNLVPRCFNCGEMGHTTRSCEAPREERTAPTVHCYNCDEDGHRVRDCPIPRKDRFACRNCGQSGHKATDCTEPRNADNVECNKCHEMGHFSRDCPQGGGGRACHNCGNEGHVSRECPEPRKLICRNCDEEGHHSRECPKPVDVSRIKCNNCGEMGHKQYQCPAPKQEDDCANDGGYNGGDNGGFGAGSHVEPSGGGADVW